MPGSDVVRDGVSQCSIFGGSVTACGSAPFAYMNGSAVLFIISGIGAAIGVLGFAWSVWDGNRKYKLARDQFEIQRQQLERALSWEQGHNTRRTEEDNPHGTRIPSQ